MPPFIDIARRTTLFDGLDSAELESLAERSEVVLARDGEVICGEGAPADRLYVVAEGSVRIAKGRGIRPGAYARNLATLKPGDVFGEMALVLDAPRSAAAIADGACELHALSRSSFDALLEARTAVGVKVLSNLARLLCLRLQGADDAIVGIQERSAAGGVGAADFAAADFDAVHANVYRGGW